MAGKLLFLSQCYPNPANPFGGIFVQRQAAELVKLGWQIKVVAPVPWFPGDIHALTGGRWPNYNLIPDRMVLGGIEVYYPRYLWLPRIRLHAYWRIFWQLPVRARINAVYREFHFDIIHSHMLYPEGWVGERLAGRHQIPHVITSHGDDALSQPIPGYSDLIGRAVCGSRATIAVSQAQRLRILKLVPESRDVQVLYNGYDEALFFPDKGQRAWVLSEMGLPENARIGLYTGALQPAKGVYELMQAFVRLEKEFSDFFLVWVGKGPSRPDLERLTRENGLAGRMKFTGALEGWQVARWMQASDFLILPSHTEGFPCVIVEAMACACPVVACEVGGVAEAVLEGRTGYLARPRDVDSLVTALCSVLTLSNAERDSLGQNACRLVSSMSWKENASIMHKIYQETLDEYPSLSAY